MYPFAPSLRQLVVQTTAIYLPVPPSLPKLVLPSFPVSNAGEHGFVDKWKAWAKWEEGNPLETEEKEKPVLMTRIPGCQTVPVNILCWRFDVCTSFSRQKKY